jgi:glycosyltransferase involved in cell wall biosynthesis
VAHGETGLVVGRPSEVSEVATALARLLDDPDRRRAMGTVARERMVSEFGYDRLADRLGEVLARW